MADTRTELLDLVSKFQPLVSKAADAGTAEAEVDRFVAPAQVREGEPDRRPAGPGQKVAVGLVIAIAAPIALAIGAYVLFYVACATGQGCL